MIRNNMISYDMKTTIFKIHLDNLIPYNFFYKNWRNSVFLTKANRMDQQAQPNTE